MLYYTLLKVSNLEFRKLSNTSEHIWHFALVRFRRVDYTYQIKWLEELRIRNKKELLFAHFVRVRKSADEVK